MFLILILPVIASLWLPGPSVEAPLYASAIKLFRSISNTLSRIIRELLYFPSKTKSIPSLTTFVILHFHDYW
jgi:hypothetical protein